LTVGFPDRPPVELGTKPAIDPGPAEIPDGTPDRVVRTVTENTRTLKFISHGFEEE